MPTAGALPGELPGSGVAGEVLVELGPGGVPPCTSAGVVASTAGSAVVSVVTSMLGVVGPLAPAAVVVVSTVASGDSFDASFVLAGLPFFGSGPPEPGPPAPAAPSAAARLAARASRCVTKATAAAAPDVTGCGVDRTTSGAAVGDPAPPACAMAAAAW